MGQVVQRSGALAGNGSRPGMTANLLLRKKEGGGDPVGEILMRLVPAVPFAAFLGVAGGVLPVMFQVPRALRAYMQHSAAGIITAVIAVELFPKFLAYEEHPAALWGFGVGAAAMVLLKYVTGRLEKRRAEGLPVGMAAAAAVDTAIDGVIVGAGFAVDPSLGLMLALGLGVELGALNLALASEFRKQGAGRWTTSAIVTLNALLLVAGAMAGAALLEGASDRTLTLVLSFSAAALLYLVTEELLVKGNEDANTAATSAAFFAAFLVLMAYILSTKG
jgi:zinc transporter, ZIP family